MYIMKLMWVIFVSVILCNNIFAMDIHTNISSAKLEASQTNKRILTIFTMDDCVYCDKLKQDLASISSAERFVVCILDKNDNEDLVSYHKIRVYPSSLIMSADTPNQVFSTKTGYKNKTDYSIWLDKHISNYKR